MLFHSLAFLLLLLLTLVLYYGACRGKRDWQVAVLVVASAVFYGWKDPRLLLLLLSICVGNAWLVACLLRAGTNQNRCLIAGIAGNLAVLFFFKYAAFFYQILPAACRSENILAMLKAIPLPIGISFFTFHAISLLVDVAHHRLPKRLLQQWRDADVGKWRQFGDLTLYMAFFPQLVAGPITKAQDFYPQIQGKDWRSIDWLQVRRCLILGFFLKMVVADNLAEHTVGLTAPVEHLRQWSALFSLPLVYGYGLQLFADFAGYSLMALGFAAMFGYQLPINFRFPYLATSITDFWRRWHISLSSWLRDYLYIPLGGNRCHARRVAINLLLVMLLGGLWHGAEWKFVLWGGMHGLCLVAERWARGHVALRKLSLAPQWLKRAWTFHVVMFLWLTFAMPDLTHVAALFQGMFQAPQHFSGPPVFALLFFGGFIIAYHAWAWGGERGFRWAIHEKSGWLEGWMHGLMLFLCITNSGAPREFIYFQF